jgi:EAL domain-containing protein (putative c-di-GMP-specific phosphodiesterase class I)
VDATTPNGAAAARETVEAVLADPTLIRPVFQPIVDLRRSAVQGYEMLARLANDPAGTPPQWLAAAERHGLGSALEASLVAAGIHAREHLPRGTYLSINVSPGALVSADVRAVLDAAPGGLDQIVVEVTERKPVDDYDELATVLDRARAAGAQVAVDDAGAGYSSLQHVLRLRPEYVKLDRGLIADADADPAKLALIEAVGLFAGRLDAALVAEGIERRAEQEILAGLAVPLGQGFLFGRPGPSLVRDVPIAGLRAVTGAVSSLLDGPPSAVLDAGLLAAGAEPPASARGQVVVVIDRDGRPTGLLVPEGGGWAHRAQPLRAGVDEPALSVARRALARPSATRLDPVCVCLPDGRFAGLVGVERLLGDEAGATDASFLLPAALAP